MQKINFFSILRFKSQVPVKETKCISSFGGNFKSSVRNKQLPTFPSQVKFAGGKLIDWEGCPLDKLKFIDT